MKTVDRRAFVAGLLAACPDALVVTGLGSPSYDVYAAGERPGNFYLWGAMGGAAAVGLGLALAQPARSVLVITGDGEQLMGLGALATAAVQRPSNLTVVVLDNGHFGETGMQRSHNSLGLNLVAVARGCGIGDAFTACDMDAVQVVAQRVNGKAGLALVQVLVAADELPRALPPRDGVYLKNRVRGHLGFAPF